MVGGSSPPLNTLYLIMQIILKSFNSSIISLFTDTRIKPIAEKLNLSVSSIVNLPTRKKIYTMNRSPHVFSKSKESFELRTFSKLITISFNKDSLISILKFEKLLAKNVVNGLSVQIKI